MFSSRSCCQSALPRRLARATRARDVSPLTGVPNIASELRPTRARRHGSHSFASFSINARSSRRLTRTEDAAPLRLLPFFLSPKRSTTAVGGLSTSFVQTARVATYSLKRKARYACMTCSKGFASLEALERHAKNVGHRTATQLPPGLASAVRSSDGKSSIFTQLLPHHCRYCNMGFRKNADLRRHMRVEHSQATPQAQNQDDNTESPTDKMAIMASLHRMCHSPSLLANVGYLFEESLLEDARWCVNCKTKKMKAKANLEAQSTCRYHPEHYDATMEAFPCCQQPGASEGCVTRPSHKFAHFTRHVQASVSKGMKRVPVAGGGSDQDLKPAAVALACGIKSDTNRLYSICAVDFMSGNILLNKYVHDLGGGLKQEETGSEQEEGDINDPSLPPSVPPGKEPLRSFKQAREELFNIIGPDTILLGHGLKTDLNGLKISHDLIVDSLLLARRVTKTKKGSWNLGSLTSFITAARLKDVDLRRTAQQNARASRDLMMHMAQYPRSLIAWGIRQRKNASLLSDLRRSWQNRSASPQAPPPRDPRWQGRR